MKTIHCGSLKHFSKNYNLNGFNNILSSNRSLVNDLEDCEKPLLLTNINFILYITRLQLIKTSRI